MKVLLKILLLCLLPVVSSAQLSPAEDAQLHYTIIRFLFPAEKGATEYKVAVVEGNIKSIGEFEKRKLSWRTSSEPSVISEVEKFGAQYTWRSAANVQGRWVYSGLHHFSTLRSVVIDSVGLRLRMTASDSRYAGIYVFVDATKGLYNAQGKLVWYVPDAIASSPRVQDLKLSPQGTILFEYRAAMYEIDYEGHVLNKLPAKDSSLINGFHHEVCRLKNGHYMGLGNKMEYIKKGGDAFLLSPVPDSSGGFKPTVFEVLNEFDENGKLVWQYKIIDYLLASDVKEWARQGEETRMHPHVNAFFFDEQNSEFYLGCRDLNRILRISYPDGRVLSEYGRKDLATSGVPGQDLFCQQHAVNVKDGVVYIFNNNGCSADHIPSILAVKESPKAEYGIDKLWEYKFDVQPMKVNRSRGGNVIPLSDGNVFTSIGTPWGQMLIVDKNGRIFWGACVERWDTESGSTKETGTYRASIIFPGMDFEKMINSGTTRGR